MSNLINAELALEAIGDPMRRRILERLGAGPTPVGELAAGLPIGRPAVSRHLRVLTTAGLVEHTSQGTRNLYVLAPDGQREVQQWLVSVWDATLTSFADFVAAEEVATPKSAAPKSAPGKAATKKTVAAKKAAANKTAVKKASITRSSSKKKPKKSSPSKSSPSKSSPSKSSLSKSSPSKSASRKSRP